MKMGMQKDSPDRARQWMNRFLRWPVVTSDCGGPFVELALVMPLFILLLAGATEYGRLTYFDIEIANAARAGAAYAAQNSTDATDTAGIQAAAANDAPNLTRIATLTTTPSLTCTCSNGAAITCTNAAATCLSPARTIKYVQVVTSATVTSPIGMAGFPTSFNLQGQATMRVEK